MNKNIQYGGLADMEALRGQFDTYIKDRTNLEGVAVATITHKSLINTTPAGRERSVNPECDAVVVKYEDVLVYIPREELEYKPATGSLSRYFGEKVYFNVTKIDDENGIIVGSRTEVDSFFRDKLAKEMEEEGVTKIATIQTILRFGAYLTIDGHSTILRNQDFSTDYTPIGDIHKIGDTIEVKLVEYTEEKDLNIEAVKKYKNKNIFLDSDDMQEGKTMLGVVQDIVFLEESHAVFTRLPSGIDALSPTPEGFDIDVGDTVVFLLRQYNPDERNVRGIILLKANSNI